MFVFSLFYQQIYHKRLFLKTLNFKMFTFLLQSVAVFFNLQNNELNLLGVLKED
jgi:hypothetical protein